ncbi:MAG: restriction endonuclease subunit S [Armatimonadota bacterium]|nr:restriction endonuclease subunit S [Armatimonadota bacterium]
MNYSAMGPEVQRRLSKPRYPLTSLGALAKMLQYGCSRLATIEPVGVPMLRMNNLQANGWDLSDLKYVQLTERELETWKLYPGDILFNRTNSKELVGKCEVFREEGDWVFASYLMRLRVNETQVLPAFVSDFLSTRAGRAQIDRLSRQIVGMSNINAEEIRQLQIPLPPLSRQIELLAELDAARTARDTRLAQADELLAGIDAFVLQALGLRLPPTDALRPAYAVPRRTALRGRNLSPDYFHPERTTAIQSIKDRYPNERSVSLRAVADFIRKVANVEPDDLYIGLANVQSNTGELIAGTEEVEGACFRFETGDVLFARLRPYLNKVYRAERSGVCSPEFHVIRIRGDEKKQFILDPDYLAAMLRSSAVLRQTRHMMTGNTHPRLANEDVINLVVPIPGNDVQKEIVLEVARRRKLARVWREEAWREWEAAKADFERALLG